MSDSSRRFVDREFTEPKVAMSACLELEQCRYNGQSIPDSFIRRLLPHVELTPICPEVEIGLGVPRDTIRLVDDDGRTRLVQPSTDEDLTDDMDAFAASFLRDAGTLDGWILKSGSPTCGPKDVKVYGAASNAPTVRTEPGQFARHVLDEDGELAVESEGRLRNYPIRHHFLTRLFSFAELRNLRQNPSVSDLVDFQRRHKHLLMTYDQEGMRELGRIAANPDGEPPDALYAHYRDRFHAALAGRPERGDYINTFQHMYGHFKEELSATEREEFDSMLDEYRAHRLPLHALLALVRSWVSRFEYEYFADQSFLEPYPRELVQMRDSGKGVDF
ncbi:MAG: YbgA family protein [Bradymonadaceae bacterium]